MSTPFLKWAGGKRYLAEEILKRLPEKIKTYHEPMVGAGAIFFELAKQNRFKRAKLSDINQELITTYKVIRDKVSTLILLLQKIETTHKAAKNPENYYYHIRELDRSESMTDTQIAARMIYLNKTGFNGLYRVNRSGKFNVPYGQYKNPTICNEELLHEVSKTLQGVELIKQDFEAATENMRMNDAAYFDPPYWPVKEGSFVAYNDNGFDSEDQARLAYVANKLKDKRIAAVFSNSDVPPVRKLYEGLHMAKVEVPRRINSDGTGRGMVSELLITTKRRP